jgi:4-alpha-glucanotransferase
MELNPRAAGVLLHITSLPGPHGLGDFGPNAFHFVDWLQRAGQSVWQLLPINPVGPADSPYQSPSAFAGSPLMVAFEPLVEKGWLNEVTVPDGGFPADKVDFGRVTPWRLDLLAQAAQGFQARATDTDREAFAQWCQSQASWLDDYCLFMAIKNSHQGQPWWTWPAKQRDRDATTLKTLRRKFADQILAAQFAQWCFDVQCAALKAYANARGIALLGDLPIFVAHDSADVWTRPDLYFLDETCQPTVVAGVPPDVFSVDGQRWGNPLYRWDRMADENYAWWTARVCRALEQADIFRIDHFRGFAGYWEVPASAPTAATGQWVPGPGKPLFDAIERALGSVPIVAEDLGLITPDVIALRDGCNFPGMRILQFAFGSDATGEFLPHNYVPHTVVYTGTHDNDTVRGWWNNAPERERAFAGSYLACGEHDVHWAMIRAASNSVAELAIFPLQDVLGLDSAHRMNLPGSQGGNWAWRFDWPMMGDEPGRVLGLITAASGRGPFGLLRLPQP